MNPFRRGGKTWFPIRAPFSAEWRPSARIRQKGKRQLMWKKFFVPLFRAEQIIEEYQREEQWKQKKNIALISIAAFLVMSLLNVYQHSVFMLITTVGGAFLIAVCLLIGWKKKSTEPMEMSFMVILMVLFTFYTIYGGNEGFALLWVIFVPFMFMMIMDLKKGLFLSAYFLALLFLVFYGPLDFLLKYDYPEMMRLRFPVLYLIDCAFSIYSVRVMLSARSDLILVRNQLKESGFRDPATGLKNRNAYTEFAKTVSEESREQLGVIFIDVNGLHELNNRKGHAEGDKLLRLIAGLCRESFPEAEIFRFGGDEFLLICDNTPEEALAEEMGLLSRRLEEKGYTVAYGIEHRRAHFDLEDMVNGADGKMLRGKAEYYKTRDRRAR